MFSQTGDESVKRVTTKFFSCAHPCPPHFYPMGQSGLGAHSSATRYGLFWALRTEQGMAVSSTLGYSGKSRNLADEVSFISGKAWV